MKRQAAKTGTVPSASLARISGAVAVLIAFLFFVPGAPLRTYTIAAQRFIQREIGQIGWQPQARAFLFHVPFYRQEHALSCEAASARSALLGVGVDIPESDILAALPRDPTTKRWDPVLGTIWGDPDKGYVGNVDGRMPSSGYGVFPGPLSAAVNRYASSSAIDVSDMHAVDRALSEFHPIIAWTVLGKRPYTTTWRTPDGRTIRAPIYEHTVVIVGYRGTADRFEGVYLVDPLTSLRYERWDEFLWRTSFFNHRGLEVAPPAP
jgi:uncharacterized protein YvpB